MLVELAVSDFAIIESLRLTFSPGFNVLTGETGAGKSILIDAVDALLGGKCGCEVVRSGTLQARIEGVFTVDGEGLDPLEQESMRSLLREYGAEGDDGTIILCREIHASGRTAARVNGRLVPLAVLQRISAALVDIHGQGDHLSILRASLHSWFLDRYAGSMEGRRAVSRCADELSLLRKELLTLARDEREVARQADLLRFQVAEIDGAMLAPDEEEKLMAEHRVLTNAEQLAEGATSIHGLLLARGEESGAIDRLLEALRQSQHLARLDPSLLGNVRTLEESSYALQDVAAEFRRYGDRIEFDPTRLKQVEDRLDVLHRLKRKYGSSVDEVIKFGDEAARQLHCLSSSGERTAELRSRENELLAALAEMSEALSQRRKEAASRLSKSVEAELVTLNLTGARFEVTCERIEDPGGLAFSNGGRYGWDKSGADRVEFLIAPNAGEPLRPLVRIASGGEASRLMLALKTVLTSVDPVPTLIFDEIDAGIGGRTARVLGAKLWQLSTHHQVLCVTHLPQIASYADIHFNIAKTTDLGRTKVAARQLMEEERAVEIAVMLGGVEESVASLANACELIARAQAAKQQDGHAGDLESSIEGGDRADGVVYSTTGRHRMET